MSVEVRPTKVVCGAGPHGPESNDGTCDVTYSRSAGGDDIGGIKLVLTDDAEDSNYIHDVSGNINPLATMTESAIVTGIINASNVESVVYFLDDSGNEQLCSPSGSLDF